MASVGGPASLGEPSVLVSWLASSEAGLWGGVGTAGAGGRCGAGAAGPSHPTSPITLALLLLWSAETLQVWFSPRPGRWKPEPQEDRGQLSSLPMLSGPL